LPCSGHCGAIAAQQSGGAMSGVGELTTEVKQIMYEIK